MSKLRVSVAQTACCKYELESTLQEVEKWTRVAAERDRSSLCVFPEVRLLLTDSQLEAINLHSELDVSDAMVTIGIDRGYPRGSSFGAVVGSRSDAGRDEFLKYHKSAITVSNQSPAIQSLETISRTTGVFIVIGVIEKDGGTLYCTACFIDPTHGLVAKHRKLMPTASERLIWGFGDATTLPVVEASLASSSLDDPELVKARVAAAICWENFVAPLRYHYYAQGVQLYCAPTVDSRETWESTIRHIAMEGRCFVLSACQYATQSDYPEGHPTLTNIPDPNGVMIAGGSAIISPLETYAPPFLHSRPHTSPLTNPTPKQILAGPLRDEKGVLTAEIDLDDCIRGKFDFDAVGHYGRPDVFGVLVAGEAVGGEGHVVVPGEGEGCRMGLGS